MLKAALNIMLAVAAVLFIMYKLAEERGRRDEERGKTVISFLSAGTRQQKDAYEQVIAAFETLHPDIKIRFEWGTSGDFFGVLLTRMAGGVAPDVSFMYEFKLPFFASKNALLDLTPLIARDFNSEWADFHPVAQEVFSYSGRVYAMPVTLAPVLLFYNRSLFDAAGLSYPDENWTWDDLLDAAKKLTRRDSTGRVLQYGLAGGLDYRMIEMLTGRRGLLSSPLRANYHDPEITAAVQYALDLTSKHKVAPDVAAVNEETNLFESEKAAMTISGKWMCPTYNQVDSLNYDVAPIPIWRNGWRGTYTHAVGYSISNATKNQEAAWKFVKFLGGAEMSEMLMTLGDTVPARLSVLHSSGFLHPSSMPENNRAFAESLDYSHFLQITDPPLPEYYRQTVEAMTIGHLQPKEALPEVSRKINHFIRSKKVTLLQ